MQALVGQIRLPSMNYHKYCYEGAGIYVATWKIAMRDDALHWTMYVVFQCAPW